MAIHLDPHPTPRRTRPAPRSTARARALPHARIHRLYPQRLTTRRAPLPGVSIPNLALAGLQLLIGYEWLVSGVDKVLLGAFPDRMGGLLTAAISGGRLPGFFAALLQNLVLPNAYFFGVMIEWGETLAGLGLVAAGLVTLLRPLAERHLTLRAALCSPLARVCSMCWRRMPPLALACWDSASSCWMGCHCPGSRRALPMAAQSIPGCSWPSRASS